MPNSHSQRVLEVRGLTVRLPADADRENAIEDIALTVEAQETLCVVGESGSGKSVTAQAVMGLLPKRQLTAVAGEIRLQGEDLLSVSSRRLRKLRGARMSMIFQEPMTALNPVIAVGRQIEEVLTTHTAMAKAARRDRVLEVMGAVGLPEPDTLRHSYPHQLSGGQRQRVMIAMALVLEPALLIADEPTTALDVTTQAQILALIKSIQTEHRTGVLFITHDFGVVAEIADTVAVMRAGRIVEMGPAGRVLSAPEHPYTQMLMAAVPSLVPPERAARAIGAIALETVGLAKTYSGGGWFGKGRTVRAVHDVSITVARGETLGIVGESGSGKSTVARCVVRLTDPSAGRIRLQGTDIGTLSPSAMRPYRGRIQIVFQDPYRSLNPRRTVGASIVEGPLNFGVAKAEAWQRARDLLDLVGVDQAAIGRYPHQFSGGQRQRLCIARALAMEPEILIADEAVSALDVSVQAQVLALLESVRDKFDLAMLFITHDLRVAAQICDRVAVMYQGEVVEIGDTGELFSDPKNAYTRQLFAAAPGRGTRFGKTL
ncbi:MAG: ABC transporter ATP-binding protein [Alphaproteobacteria bacterium]